MPELAKYHTFNTVIIGAGVTLRWRGDTGASPFPPVALRNDGRKNKCTPRGGFWGYPPRLFFRAESTYKPPQPLGEYLSLPKSPSLFLFNYLLTFSVNG